MKFYFFKNTQNHHFFFFLFRDSSVQVHIGEININIKWQISFVLNSGILTYHQNVFSRDEIGDNVAYFSAGFLSVFQTSTSFISFNF